MALVLADRVRETTTVTGTGTATLLGAVSGYQSFSAVGNANTTYYVIANQSATEWEVGIGTYTSSGTTLSRDTVLSSSNSGSLVNFSAGTKDVFVDYPASKAVYENAAGNVDGYPITGGTIDNTTIGATTPSTGVFTTLTATGQTSLGGVTDVESFRVSATSGTAGNNNYLWALGSASSPSLYTWGTSTNVPMLFRTRGSGQYEFATGSSSGTIQARIAHTASAVNYVQVTGAATGGSPTISAQGSDSNTNLQFNAKGYGSVLFASGPSNRRMFEAVYGTGSDANWLRVAGAASSSSPILSAQGSDTNISQVFQSKGTGAIDLAAGSSGVNISNGGTVTAITRTAAGSGYTSIPSVAISAPTTAGGVQSTATAIVQIRNTSGVTINSGGTGYTVNDVLTVSGGTGTAATFTVATVSGGVITSITLLTSGGYSALPTFPASVTGGTGSSATFTFTDMSMSATPVTITNAGSGYVEQPTVTFSGGGGSGAAAYATVGGTTIVRSLGTNLDFYTPGGAGFRVGDNGTTNAAYWSAFGGPTAPVLRAVTTASGIFQTSGAYPLVFQTNFGTEQLRVSHTASAVNYVQVTGAATAAYAQISAQGSDTNPGILYTTKGTGEHRFSTAASITAIQFRVRHINSPANYCAVIGAPTGSAPEFQTLGTDTNIDLALTPKGTGNVRFGTYTGTALSIAGYIEIKDSGGTVRKLAVVA